MANILKRFHEFGGKLTPKIGSRFHGTKVKQRTVLNERKFKATEESLASKGFLRSVKPYSPPDDVELRVSSVCSRVGLTTDIDTVIGDPAIRFSILNECFQEFQHGVPNSTLNTIETIGDVMSFYKTPVVTTTPYDAMRNMDLPKNLHVQFEYQRFNPETDTMFGGISAFPKSSTLVSGLKYKKKYPGYQAKTSWP